MLALIFTGCHVVTGDNGELSAPPVSSMVTEPSPSPQETKAGEEASPVRSATPTPVAESPTAPVITSTPSAPVSAAPESFAEDGQYRLSGFIDDLKIHMDLVIKDHNVVGTYYYDRYERPISLKGSIEDGAVRLFLRENEASQEYIYGLVEGDSILGIWTDYKRYLRFVASERGVDKPLPAPVGEIQRFSGAFDSTEGDYFAHTNLKFAPVTERLVYFEMYAFNGDRNGWLAGVAVFDGGKVIYTETAGSDAPIDFVFTAENEQIVLDTTDYTLNCGSWLSYGKQYAREQYAPPDALDFLSDEQNARLKRLTGQYFQEFCKNVQLVSEDQNIDAFEADVYQFGIVGYSHYGIIMINKQNGAIMAAIPGDEIGQYFYFSDDPQHTTPPKTISDFMLDGKYIRMGA